MKKLLMTAGIAVGLLFAGNTAEAAKPVVTVDTAGLNVRQTPSTDLNRVGLVYKGQQFDYVKKQGQWVQIKFKGKDRWVHGAYVKIGNEKVVYQRPKAQPVKKQTVAVKAAPQAKAQATNGRKVTMNVSAYTAQCVGCSGITASGFDVRNRVTKDGMRIVAAPPGYKFGTVMHIPGYGKAVVLDRGGAIKGNKLDLLVATKQEAINWGRRNVTVTVY